MSGVTVWTRDAWLAEGKRRFGLPWWDWRFVCPRCNTVQTARELLEALQASSEIEASAGTDEVQRFMAYSCIGRWRSDKGCDWTLGGLFQIHQHEVEFEDGTRRPVFAFAAEEASHAEA